MVVQIVKNYGMEDLLGNRQPDSHYYAVRWFILDDDEYLFPSETRKSYLIIWGGRGPLIRRKPQSKIETGILDASCRASTPKGISLFPQGPWPKLGFHSVIIVRIEAGLCLPNMMVTNGNPRPNSQVKGPTSPELQDLRVLKLTGIMHFYQLIIWQTVWINPQLATLQLEMAVGLDFKKPVGPSGWGPSRRDG